MKKFIESIVINCKFGRQDKICETCGIIIAIVFLNTEILKMI